MNMQTVALGGMKLHFFVFQYFPNGYAFATGSDDATCRLFDIRADQVSDSLTFIVHHK